jgi:pescadillo protein
MNTFLEFNQTLLGFVNYKLYSDLGLVYPPVMDKALVDGGASLASFVLENVSGKEIFESKPAKKVSSKKLQAKVDQSLKGLKDEIVNDVEEEEEVMEEDDEFTPAQETPATNGLLFAGHVFWISREVPLYMMQFIIKACGGKLGWEMQAGSGSPFESDDSRITIQITDRPLPEEMKKREYLQPQWIYDCINQNKLLKTNGYHPGETLPPHLSPFAIAGEDDYSPMEELKVSYYLTKAPEVVDDQSEVEDDAEDIEVKESKEADKDKELAKIMMSKRDRKLYDKIQFGKDRKKVAADKLREKRRALKK